MKFDLKTIGKLKWVSNSCHPIVDKVCYGIPCLREKEVVYTILLNHAKCLFGRKKRIFLFARMCVFGGCGCGVREQVDRGREFWPKYLPLYIGPNLSRC